LDRFPLIEFDHPSDRVGRKMASIHLRRGIAICLGSIYLSLSLVTPAKAFLPVAVLAAPAIYAAGSTYALGALAGLVGLAGGYLLLSDSLNNQVAIPLGDKPSNQPLVPTAAPSTAQTGGQIECGRWSTTTLPYSFTSEVCAGSGIANCSGEMIGGACVVNDIEHRTYQVTQGGVSGTCPNGYSSSGGTCTLVNARQVTDDKRCDILLTNHQYSTAADMNCPSTVDGSKLAPMIRDGKVIAYGTNSSGQPMMWEVSSNTTQVTIKQMEQVQTATQTQVKTTEIAVHPTTSAITSVQTSTQVGSIAAPGGSSLPSEQPTTTTPENTPTVTTKPAEQVQPEQNINTCGLPGKPACAVDDSGFTGAPKPWADVPLPDFDAPKNAILNITDPLISWRDWLPSLLPGSPTACHPIEFRGKISIGPAAGLDSTTELDICWLFDYIRMFLGFIFGVATIIYIWRSIMGTHKYGLGA